MSVNPKRGEIWMAQFDPTRGHEQAKMRPCVILSINKFNSGPSNLVIALPLTTKQRAYVSRITVSPQNSGLERVSYVLCEQIRVLSLCRFSNQSTGKVSPRTMSSIEKVLTTLLGFRASY